MRLLAGCQRDSVLLLVMGCLAVCVWCVQNDLVDALEFLSSLAVLSGMDIEEKIRCEH